MKFPSASIIAVGGGGGGGGRCSKSKSPPKKLSVSWVLSEILDYRIGTSNWPVQKFGCIWAVDSLPGGLVYWSSCIWLWIIEHAASPSIAIIVLPYDESTYNSVSVVKDSLWCNGHFIINSIQQISKESLKKIYDKINSLATSVIGLVHI